VKLDFEVAKDDLRSTRVVESAPPEPQARQALLRVERFGFTANNVTYALLGETIRYWDFFPTEPGWGRIPVWGFAEVITAAGGLEEGVRVYGYLPMSTHVTVTPARVDDGGFVDAAEHRAALPPAYNLYRRLEADPTYHPDREDEQLLLKPLFFLSFCLDDFLAVNDCFGADAIVMSSASSKSALGTAFLLSKRDPEVIGLTSPRNVEPLERLGVYDRVATYEDVAGLPAGRAVYLDLAGNPDVRAAVHRHYGDQLLHSAAVGATHWDSGAGWGEPEGDGLPGPKPTPFFAPDRLRARAKEWGAAGLDAGIVAAWEEFVAWAGTWLEVVRGAGPEAVGSAYRDVLSGRTRPSTGHVLTMWRERSANVPQ
jgi:hypothetical protein